mgnify:CR=1 FL=1
MTSSIKYTNAEKMELNDRQDIKKFIQNNNSIHILLKFSASWCGPCKILNDIINKLIDNYSSIKEKPTEDILIIDINVDKQEDISRYFKIRQLPTILTFFNTERNHCVQGCNETDIYKLIKKL